MEVKYLKTENNEESLRDNFPNSATGVVFGEAALLVKCGGNIYDETSDPFIYHHIAKYTEEEQ